MTEEEAQEARVSKAEAIAEIKRHGHDAIEFFDEIGEKEEYPGHVVLAWLGY